MDRVVIEQELPDDQTLIPVKSVAADAGTSQTSGGVQTAPLPTVQAAGISQSRTPTNIDHESDGTYTP